MGNSDETNWQTKRIISTNWSMIIIASLNMDIDLMNHQTMISSVWRQGLFIIRAA